MTKVKIPDHTKNPVLRQVSQPVPLSDIGTKKLDDILKRMSDALHEQEDGVAIAAPQIGEGLRIFIVNARALESAKSKVNSATPRDLVFINPQFVKLSQKKSRMEEGCLSVRWLYGEVLRSEKATVKAYDENGKAFQKGASGLLAQIFQHEIDHLDGVLFIDKATNVADMPPPEPLDAARGKKDYDPAL